MDLIEQRFDVSIRNKSLYGEVHTDYKVIQQMFNLFPRIIFQNPSLKWLDPACGKGYYVIILFQILYEELKGKIPNDKERKEHIIQNMIYMIEINSQHINDLRKHFGDQANILNMDFLSFNPQFKFDCIVGNPPYNINGLKKVPTNITKQKKKDGITIWPQFIRHSISLLSPNGWCSMIIPSIWMKPDREKMYDFLLQFHIHKIRCFSNTETNKMFHGQAQTPTCFFLLQKKKSVGYISLFDRHEYISWPLKERKPIPLCCISILKCLQKYVTKYKNC